MSGLFEGKVAVVTGGASGLGAAAVAKFARQGASVVVADIAEDKGAAVVAQVREAGGVAEFLRTDVSRVADMETLAAFALDRFGRLDAAVNSAGTPGRYTDVVACDEEEFDRVVALNLKSVWAGMKFQIPAMLRTGGGAIVNIASVAAINPPPHMATYVATKAGVVGLTRSAAMDFSGRGVRVNAVLPGPVHTPMLETGMKGLDRPLEAFGSRLPIGRIGQPREAGDTIAWLCSAEASFITGISLPLDGGLQLL